MKTRKLKFVYILKLVLAIVFISATHAFADHEPTTTQLPDHLMSQALANGTLIDLRGAKTFATNHPTGAIFLPTGKRLISWSRQLLSPEERLYLLVKDVDEAKQAIGSLKENGFNNIEGYFLPSALESSAVKQSSIHRISASQLDEKKVSVVDVRTQKEWDEEHLDGAQHLPLSELIDKLDQIPDGSVLYCRSGVRSMIAAGLLERAGLTVSDVIGGWRAIRERR